MAAILGDIKKKIEDKLNEPDCDGSFAPDPRRHKACYPGKLVYSAKVDDEKIVCFYRWLCQCLPPAAATTRTFVDIYTNAVVINAPSVACCCCAQDNSRILFFDQSPYAKPAQKTGCCDPLPYCCAQGVAGQCGEVVALPGPTVGCPSIGFGHLFGMVFCCLLPVNFICGLKEGEAQKTADAINKEVAKYRESGGKYEFMV